MERTIVSIYDNKLLHGYCLTRTTSSNNQHWHVPLIYNAGYYRLPPMLAIGEDVVLVEI